MSRMLSSDDIKRIVSRYIQPLYQGTFAATEALKATLSGLIPFGDPAANFEHASPFGMVSKPVKGVVAYLLNLHGSALAPVILNHLHKTRPEPTADGETVLYSMASDGSAVKVKITLGADGVLKIEAPTKVQVLCDEVEIGTGALEKIVNGETFRTFFNQHEHEGNAGVPTGPPILPMTVEEHLSSQVKASI